MADLHAMYIIKRMRADLKKRPFIVRADVKVTPHNLKILNANLIDYFNRSRKKK